ncbi:hypothetical protein [Cupriavidus oxalaticus]|uniref:hypothetical protein n=1 Tax=Cupriavidus oxalaticus TaxID=96344 RepID=UPI001F0D9F3D|nr:hypothetical protein [Cupriavidus oxalaticus]
MTADDSEKKMVSRALNESGTCFRSRCPLRARSHVSRLAGTSFVVKPSSLWVRDRWDDHINDIAVVAEIHLLQGDAADQRLHIYASGGPAVGARQAACWRGNWLRSIWKRDP